MPPSPLPARRSFRIAEYDYAQPGVYFVTVVTQGRKPLLGKLSAGDVVLTEIGQIAYKEWFRTATLRPYIHLESDEFVIMPNHIHGIIWIVEKSTETGSTPVGAQRRCAPTTKNGNPKIGVSPGSLGAIVRGYKSAVTYRVNALNNSRGAPLWQRNYYEHILRSEHELENAHRYILSNPLKWEQDIEYLKEIPS